MSILFLCTNYIFNAVIGNIFQLCTYGGNKASCKIKICVSTFKQPNGENGCLSLISLGLIIVLNQGKHS